MPTSPTPPSHPTSPESHGDQYRRRHGQHIAADRRRQRAHDWEATRLPGWVAGLSLLCLLILAVMIIVLSQSDRVSRPMAINGDQLGFVNDTVASYQQESDAALAAATSGPDADTARWALLTPTHPVNLEEATTILRDTPARVSSLLFGGGAIAIPMPEPAIGHTRADVLTTTLTQLGRRSLTPTEELRIDGILVHATPAVLSDLRHRPEVFAIEMAPVDAAYGRIGIRTVDP